MEFNKTDFSNDGEFRMTFDISRLSWLLNLRESDLFSKYLKLMTAANRSRLP